MHIILREVVSLKHNVKGCGLRRIIDPPAVPKRVKSQQYEACHGSESNSTRVTASAGSFIGPSRRNLATELAEKAPNQKGVAERKQCHFLSRRLSLGLRFNT